MKQVTHNRYSKGSTGFHTAVPPQTSDGRSGGVPRMSNTLPLRKPAVLATCFPELSQGTPGAAIGAELYHPGPVLPKQQHGNGGAEPPPANRWKALILRIKAKVKWWRAQIHRYYLTLMRKHMALITKLTFGYIRLIVFMIGILPRSLFRKPTLPNGAINTFAHDRRFALFRRRAVGNRFGMFPHQIPEPSTAWSADDRLTNTHF